MTKKCDVVVDLQFGSTGKGLIAGYLAKKYKYDTVVNANMPNAGHTFIDDSGRKWVHKVLPNGIVSPNLKNVMIGPGSVFDIERFFDEIIWSKDLLKDKVILVHQDAVVLQESHKHYEAENLNGISSTMQGSAAAMIEKILRNDAKDSRAKAVFDDFMEYQGITVEVVSPHRWIQTIYEAESILLEGAQGYSLGINAGFWPYCTSRDCTPARFMADCGVPLGFLRRVIGTARTYPIRVGNTENGYSGDGYTDQEEISWDDIGVAPEKTTVTGRVRRIFTFSNKQIQEAIAVCQPNEVFLNFANYCPKEISKIITDIEKYQQQMVAGGGSVRYVGWGPNEGDVQERHFLNPCDYTKKEMQQGWVS